jgi:hypothetical protein
MSRGAVYLNLDEELFDVFAIKSIRRFETYDTDKGEMVYGIIVNEEVHTDSPFRDVKFTYADYEFRETKLKEIKNKLTNFEYIIIL